MHDFGSIQSKQEVFTMLGFTYYTPTKVAFGKGSVERVGELMKQFGGTRVLIHYGGQSAVRSGVLDRVKKSLDEAGIFHVELGGVVPNPHLAKVREGIELSKANGVDFLLAVGGGSVIDSCKAIAYGLAEPEHDVWELYAGQRKAKACFPVASVLTIAAAGSEMSNSCVITNTDTEEKRAYNDDLARPKFAIMDPELTSFKTMFDYKLEPEVYNFHLLDALIKAAEKEGITNFPIHVKLDTGMHRLGFSVDEIPLLIRRLKSQNAVIPRSVFSHFVGSDSAQFDFFTRQQIELFEKGSQELQEAFSHKILRHICNTAGIERFPGAQFDMVRLGIGLYGVSPIDNSIINNVSTLKTTILQIRDVPGEDTVGYSRMGHLTRPSRIAAIPIGYADGLNRHLGRGNAYCLVNGKKAPYVGNICMDVCMIDVTDIDCREGDKAVIFGDDLPITTLSDKLGTIPYEVLTSISNRVKRVYYQD